MISTPTITVPPFGNAIPICLKVVTGDSVASFKNCKRTIRVRRTGQLRPLTDPKVKKRMQRLEAGIESALYSFCQTTGSGTDLACLKQLRTALSGLSDDSLKIIPESSFGMRMVPKGQEGVEITIERIE